MNVEELENLVRRSTLAQGVEDFTTAEILANEALNALDELSVSLNKIKLLPLRARANSTLGNIALFRSNYQQALEYFMIACSNYKEIDHHEGIAAAYCSIANVFSGLSDYVRELEYSLKSLAIYKELGDKSGIARIIGNIGVVYRNLADYDKAKEYYHTSLKLYEELDDKSGMARNFGNIGGIYWNLSDNETALTYYKKALAINEEIGNKSSIAVNLSSIGISYAHFSEYTQSLEYFQRALAIFEELGRKSSIAINIINIASIYAKSNYEYYDAAKSEKLFLQGIELCEQIGAKQYLYTAHNYLASLYRKEHRWEEADKNFQAFHTLKEEVQNEAASKAAQQLEHRRKIEESERDRQVKLARFQEQEKILHNILPSQIADRMIDGEKTIADSHEIVSVFFSDIVGFTKLSQLVSAEELVGMLNGIFTQFDQLARMHGLEKIKTIGDAYMAVCGAPIHVENHAERAALFALDVAELMNNYQTNNGDKVMIRIGLHSGSVVAGIIGENKFSYDMWGDAVNTASRMESHGEAGKIHVSEEFKQALQKGFGLTPESPKSPKSLHLQARGELDIKGKGSMNTYFLERAT